MTGHFTCGPGEPNVVDVWRAANAAFRDWLNEIADPSGYIGFARNSFRPFLQYELMERISAKKIAIDLRNIRYVLRRIIPRMEFYLDTNTLVNMLTDCSGPYLASQEFFGVVRKLNIPIRVWLPTMDELWHAINVTIRQDIDRAVKAAKHHQYQSDLSPFAVEYLSEKRWVSVQDYIEELSLRKRGVFYSLNIHKVSPPDLNWEQVLSLTEYLFSLEKGSILQARHDAICVLSTLARSTMRKFMITDLYGKEHPMYRPAIFVTCDSVLATQVREQADVAILCLELAFMLDEVVSIIQHRDGFYRRMENKIRNGFSNADRIQQWLSSDLSDQFLGGVTLDV